jgi:hypothetical protein
MIGTGVLESGEEAESSDHLVVENWLDELRRLAPVDACAPTADPRAGS